MAGSSSPGGFGFGPGTSGVWQGLEQLASRFERRQGTRVSKGDVRAAVITLLAEQPMHGYQIIREIAERSGGSWRPSAGSVYPTLQLLADEGLVSAVESNGRKTYSLTEVGRSAAADASVRWEQTDSADATDSSGGADFAALPRAGAGLAQAAARVGRNGSPEQVQQAVTVLDEARRRLYSILAED